MMKVKELIIIITSLDASYNSQELLKLTDFELRSLAQRLLSEQKMKVNNVIDGSTTEKRSLK